MCRTVEQQLMFAGDGMGKGGGLYAEDRADPFGGQCLVGWTAGDNPSGVEDIDVVTPGGGQIDVMQRRHRGQPQCAHTVQDIKLVMNVEMIGRFVE